MALFRATSAHRIYGLQSFSPSVSRCPSRDPLLFCCYNQLRFGWVAPTAPLPQRSTVRLAVILRCSVQQGTVRLNEDGNIIPNRLIKTR